jgi:hypothetical protein
MLAGGGLKKRMFLWVSTAKDGHFVYNRGDVSWAVV